MTSKMWFSEILAQNLFSLHRKLEGLLEKNDRLTDQVCSVYRAFFILTESAKNYVQKIVDRTVDSSVSDMPQWPNSMWAKSQGKLS